MTTPNPVSQHRRAEPVPQWCYDAAEEIIGHRATYIAAIIARHAPQAEPPQPAPRYACSKLAAVGDTVKVLGSEPPLIMKVEELSPTGGLYIKSPTGAWCMLLNSSQVEFVPEVTPAQPVEPQQASAERWRHFPLNMKSCADGEFVTAADHDAAIAELRAEVERVKQWELDAWRTVGNLEDAAEGRPIEIEDGKSPHPTVNVIAELREKLADEERRGDLHADLNKRVAEAIGNPFTGPGSSWHDLPEKVAALRTRAESAEAKCAHWYDELTRIAHHFRVSVDPDDTQKLNPEGTAKLAASFRTRAEAAEAKCDAIRVQWQSLHDEREEQHAALRRRGIRFVKVGGVLEAIGADRELDMLKTPQSQADIDEAEEIAEGCVVNMENFDDVSSSEMHLVCTRLLNLREQQRRLQRHIRDKEAVIDELSGRCEKLAAEHAAALGLVADIRNALGDNGKRMQPELLVHCTQLAAANERVAEFEARLDAVRKMISAGQ